MTRQSEHYSSASAAYPSGENCALGVSLTRDRRVPLRLRAILPGLVLYLASPLDLIPEFIPVIGLLDDALIGVVGIGLLLRFTPRTVLREHLERLEGLRPFG